MRRSRGCSAKTCLRRSARREGQQVGGVKLHGPEALKAEDVLHPQEFRGHGLEVRGDVIDMVEAEAVLSAQWLFVGDEAGKERRVAAALDEAEGRAPKGAVIENSASVPPWPSLKRWTSVIIVPPRSSRRRKVVSMSSTSKTSVPTSSGCLRRKRWARPPSPTGSQMTRVTSPAWNTAERCRPSV
jgi:hypothetical protein